MSQQQQQQLENLTGIETTVRLRIVQISTRIILPHAQPPFEFRAGELISAGFIYSRRAAADAVVA